MSAHGGVRVKRSLFVPPHGFFAQTVLHHLFRGNQQLPCKFVVPVTDRMQILEVKVCLEEKNHPAEFSVLHLNSSFWSEAT
jgi:hypothetical protein